MHSYVIMTFNLLLQIQILQSQLEWMCQDLQESCKICKILQVPCTYKACMANLAYTLQFSCSYYAHLTKFLYTVKTSVLF